MNKALCLFLAGLLLLGTAGCSEPAPADTTQVSAPAVVTFADPVLEAKVRKAMDKPEGDITLAEAEAVSELLLGNELPEGLTEKEIITNLSGLECFTGLTNLELTYNGLISIRALSGMTGLKRLCLGNNLVSDLSPLSGLDLEELQVWGNDYLTDISPLSGMTHLKVLMIGGCPVTDISAVAYMKELSVLDMANCKASDISALKELPLRKLYLSGNPVEDYTPILDIYNSLKDKDFTAPFTLRDLGFSFVDHDAVAGYKTETMAITVNHDEWGTPAMELENNSVKMYLQLDSGYELIVIYYPVIDAYVFQMSRNNEMIMNYIYDSANGGFTLGSSYRESAEQVIKDALGETDADDVLLAPIPIFNDTIKNTFGITADALYSLPFEPVTLKSLGFVTDEAKSVCIYEQHEPHDMHISIHKPEWGKNTDSYNPDGCSIEFYDDDVNGYSLLILYFADAERYHIALYKDGAECAFESCPATNEYGQEYPDLDTVHQMLGAAFGTQGKEMYNKPLAHFEQVVKDRFGMSIEELYALPVGE